MAIHKFGRCLRGRRTQFFGTLEDAEFQTITAHGLPPGWFAWHIDEKELRPPNARVRAIRKVPIDPETWQAAWFFATGKHPPCLTA